MNTDTSVIVVTTPGVGLALWRAMDSRHKDTRQDMATLRQEVRAEIATLNGRIDALRQELRTDMAALHSRIDALYQALFNHKDPAA